MSDLNPFHRFPPFSPSVSPSSCHVISFSFLSQVLLQAAFPAPLAAEVRSKVIAFFFPPCFFSPPRDNLALGNLPPPISRYRRGCSFFFFPPGSTKPFTPSPPFFPFFPFSDPLFFPPAGNWGALSSRPGLCDNAGRPPFSLFPPPFFPSPARSTASRAYSFPRTAQAAPRGGRINVTALGFSPLSLPFPPAPTTPAPLQTHASHHHPRLCGTQFFPPLFPTQDQLRSCPPGELWYNSALWS